MSLRFLLLRYLDIKINLELKEVWQYYKIVLKRLIPSNLCYCKYLKKLKHERLPQWKNLSSLNYVLFLKSFFAFKMSLILLIEIYNILFVHETHIILFILTDTKLNLSLFDTRSKMLCQNHTRHTSKIKIKYNKTQWHNAIQKYNTW